MSLRSCLRPPIPEIYEAARHLDLAVTAHLRGEYATAGELFRLADNKVVWNWTDSVWGKKSPYIQFRPVPNPLPEFSREQRSKPRDASTETKLLIHQRNGYYCRFCKIPVVRDDIRKRISKKYPDSVSWGKKNESQHAAFQCMWAQYDHIIPHARGGTSHISNIFLTCAACNYGRMSYTLEEVSLMHSDSHAIQDGPWDGLERFR